MTCTNPLLLRLAGAAAGLACVLSAASAEGPDGNTIADVQIGERGRLTRIAVVCRAPCRFDARASGQFFLPGVGSSMQIDLSGRSHNLKALTIEPADGGALVTVLAPTRPARTALRTCQINGAPAACVDMAFAERGAVIAESAPPPDARPQQTVAPGLRQADEILRPAAPSRPLAQPKLAAATSAQTALREATAADRPAVRPQLSPPPERLAAPAPGAPDRLRSDDPAPDRPSPEGAPRLTPTLAAATATASARRPILRTGEVDLIGAAPSGVGAGARAILGKRLSGADCEAAVAALAQDAWALDAMITVGFCRASAGALEEGDGVFKRLLAYTPDNYEALVGRALIAREAGEKSVARKYFQDALNALPPDEQTSRIVEAMNRL